MEGFGDLEKDKKKKKKFGESESKSVGGGGISQAAFSNLQAQVNGIITSGTFATQADVTAAVAAHDVAEDARAAAELSAQLAIDAAQNAAAAAEEAADAIEEATTDTEQTAQDSAIAANATNIAALDTGLTQAQSDIVTHTSDISNRVIRAGDTMTGQLVGVPGSQAAPGFAVGSADSGWYELTAGATHRYSIGNFRALQVHKDSGGARAILSIFGGSSAAAGVSLLAANNLSAFGLNSPAINKDGSQSIILPDKYSKVNGESLSVISGGTSSPVLEWSDEAIRHTKDSGNLVYNGMNWRKDKDTNWAQVPTSYDPSDKSWTFTGTTNGVAYMKERFPLAKESFLHVEAWIKGTGAAQTAGVNKYYMGVGFYDLNGASIDIAQQIWRAGTNTTLTQPFSPGDLEMHVADASSWVDKVPATPYTATLAFVDPVLGAEKGAVSERSGITSAYYYEGGVADELLVGPYTVDIPNNKIVFNNGAAGCTLPKLFVNGVDTWPVGTIVRQPYTRSANFYTHIHLLAPAEWTKIEHDFNVLALGEQLGPYGLPRNAVEGIMRFLPHRSTGGLEGTLKIREIRAGHIT